MSDIMTIMDLSKDLPKPGGHLGKTVRIQHGDADVEVTARELRKICETPDNRRVMVFYQGEFHTVMAYSVNDKSESKFKNRWFSMGIYIE
jgi:hypothetical protein